MKTFIIFSLLTVLAIHSYNTRQKLFKLANIIDEIHETINRTFVEDRVRITELELQLDKLKWVSNPKKRGRIIS